MSLLLLASLAVTGAAPDTLHTVTREGWAMGTRVHVYVESVSADAARAAAEDALGTVERYDGLLSTWIADSEMSRVNTATPGVAVPISPELSEVLVAGVEWSRRTDGAFEAQIGALLDVWDLRGDGRVPTSTEIARALALTGPTSIRVERDSVTRVVDGAWLDTGAFGKGAALAAVAARLHERPLSRVVVDLGGQIWSRGAFEVDVAHPTERERPLTTLSLIDASVATSGQSERYIDVDGERYGHVIDPRTGRPVPAWGSVTVVHSDPLAADVLATALLVMGPDLGLEWAELNQTAALFLDVRSGKVARTRSAEWKRMIGHHQP